MDSLARSCRTAAHLAWKHFRLLAGIALVVGLTLTLAANRDALAAVDWSIAPLTLAGAIALLAAAPLAQALTLRIALRRLGAAAQAVGDAPRLGALVRAALRPQRRRRLRLSRASSASGSARRRRRC